MTSDMKQIRDYFGSTIPVVAYHAPNAERSKTIERLYLEVAQRLNLPLFTYDIYSGLEQVIPAVETEFYLNGELYDGEVCQDTNHDYYTGAELTSDSIKLEVQSRTVSGVAYQPVQAKLAHPVIDIFRFIENYKRPGIFMLIGFGKFLEGNKQLLEAVAAVQRVSCRLKETYKRVLLLEQSAFYSTDFSGVIYEVRATLPSKEELQEEINICIGRTANDFEEMGAHLTIDLANEAREALAVAAQGLTIEQTLTALRIDMRSRRRVDAQTADALIAEKVEQLSKINVKFSKAPDVEPQGFLEFQTWVGKRGKVFQRTAHKQQSNLQLATPKGCLIVGPPGTGKSLAAKAIGYRWKCPILSVNIGDFMGSLVGETEKNWRAFTEILEHLGPCVLHMDEIEKGLAGVSGQSTDSGVSQRLFGAILTWMNDKTCPVFVVATANNIQALPPELLRKGRFDEIWFMDLPNTQERKDIIKVHLSRHRVTLSDLDMDQLLQATSEFSGAEIKQTVDDAAYLAADEDLDTIELRHLLETAGSTITVARSQAVVIAQLREWATGGGARNASEPLAAAQLPSKTVKGSSRKAKMLLDNN